MLQTKQNELYLNYVQDDGAGIKSSILQAKDS